MLWCISLPSTHAYICELSRQLGVQQASAGISFILLEVFLFTGQSLHLFVHESQLIFEFSFHVSSQEFTLEHFQTSHLPPHPYLTYAHRPHAFINTTTWHTSNFFISTFQYAKFLLAPEILQLLTLSTY
jgi:hypothetical protein